MIAHDRTRLTGRLPLHINSQLRLNILSAEDAEDAELLWRITFTLCCVVAVQVVVLIESGYFSAKDAKDAKCFRDVGFVAGGHLSINASIF